MKMKMIIEFKYYNNKALSFFCY